MPAPQQYCQRKKYQVLLPSISHIAIGLEEFEHMHRNCRLVGLLTGLALLVSLLVGCGQSAPSTPVAAAPTPTAISQPTATASPTATPFFVDGKAYQRVTDSMFGFTFAIPADAKYLSTNPLPLGVVGDSITWSDADSNPSNGLDAEFGGATNGYAANQCPQALPGTTIVTVGPGIKGYQSNNLVLGSTPQGAAGLPSISVSFVSNGNVVGIKLLPATHGDSSNITGRYMGIWQEMLASFKPGTFVNSSPPCGS